MSKGQGSMVATNAPKCQKKVTLPKPEKRSDTTGSKRSKGLEAGNVSHVKDT